MLHFIQHDNDISKISVGNFDLESLYIAVFLVYNFKLDPTVDS